MNHESWVERLVIRDCESRASGARKVTAQARRQLSLHTRLVTLDLDCQPRFNAACIGLCFSTCNQPASLRLLTAHSPVQSHKLAASSFLWLRGCCPLSTHTRSIRELCAFLIPRFNTISSEEIRPLDKAPCISYIRAFHDLSLTISCIRIVSLPIAATFHLISPPNLSRFLAVGTRIASALQAFQAHCRCAH